MGTRSGAARYCRHSLQIVAVSKLTIDSAGCMQDELKKQAAWKAVEYVKSGMKIGALALFFDGRAHLCS